MSVTKINPHHIRLLREEKGWSRNQLAQFLGVDPSTVTRWEGGSPPTGTAAVVLAAATAKFAATTAGAVAGLTLFGPLGAAAGLYAMLRSSFEDAQGEAFLPKNAPQDGENEEDLVS